MFYLRTTLMLLMAFRLLMPPGICVCKLNSPAARALVKLLQMNREVPPPENDPNPDDHDSGCPASPLAAAMGLRPPSEPPPSLAPSFDPPPLLASSSTLTLLVDDAVGTCSDPPDAPLFLTLCALVI